MLRTAGVAAFALLLTGGDAGAAREKPKPETKRVQAAGEWAFKRLTAAHEALAAEKTGEALRVLGEMQESRRLNDHERALMWQTYGYVYSAQEKYGDAAAAFEKCLALGGLPDAAQLNTQYNLAQLYVMLERYAKAVELFRDWFAEVENPAAEAHYMYAIALVQNGDKRAARRQAEIAVEKAPQPKEPWLQLLLSLYFENKDYRKSVGVLERLVTYFPKKTYWMQLSAVHSELGDHKKALSALELAYEQDLLAEESELMNLAQLYLYNEIPYKAGRVLEKAMAEGKVAGSARAWELLANAWLAARERSKALEPLEEASARASDGKLFLRLAQLQIDREEWGAARASLGRALAKGKLGDPGSAHLLLGIASASEEDWEAARAAFEAAAKHEKVRDAARSWIERIDAETDEGADVEDSTEAAAAPLPQPNSVPAVPRL